MSLRFILYILAVCGFATSSPADACRYLVNEAKTRLATSIITGEAYCTRASGKCNIRVTKVQKGNELAVGELFQINADYMPLSDSDEIIIGRCGINWPEDGSFKTEFYLLRKSDGSYSVLGSLDTGEDKANSDKSFYQNEKGYQ